jgi:pSer/pThr/pTyr-binding forkhead associated (FHA) protein
VQATLHGPAGRIALGPAVLTIGRTADNQLVVNDAKASSHHAEIRPGWQGYTITDLGSLNGTFVNGQRLEPHVARPLRTGDGIHIGDTLFVYQVMAAAEAVRPRRPVCP